MTDTSLTAREPNALPVVPSAGAKISADSVVRLENDVARTVALIDDLDVLEEWRARAAALEAYLRGKDLQAPMLGAQRRVEARIGQLAEVGYHGNHGINNKLVAEFKALGRGLAELELTEDEWRKSRRSLVALVRNRLGLREAPPLPGGTFSTIVADPPWQLTTGATMPGKFGDIALKDGGDALTYEQMPLEDIRALAIEELAAPNAHLYLWTVNKYIEAAYEIARTWGFTPSTLLTWCKPVMGVGLGGTFRQTTEFVLFARRGSIPTDIVPSTWFQWPRGKHSVKPDAFFELVEGVSPEPRLELFARQERSGWTAWGDEVADVA